MKHIIALLLGLAVGAAIFTAGIIYNPFSSKQSLSPLAVTGAQTVNLTYSVVAANSIIYTNDGESRVAPHPEKILQLWEAPIRKTSAMATVMRDGRNQVAGLGVKISSASEATRLFSGELIVNSVWYVYMPGRGGLFVEQVENYWDYFRNIVVPAYRSSANNWKGSWLGNMTSGPGALSTAAVSGSSGDFDGMETLGVESLAVKAWRVDGGPVAAEGQLLIELPREIVGEVAQD